MALAFPSSVLAQAAATATHTQWDIFAATGGDGTATQNVASILRDAGGVAGPVGAVWFTGQNPEPRLGRLDPDTTTNNYTEWRPFTGVDNAAGAPLGLAVNASNGDLWIAVQGAPSVLLKQGFSNNFRRFDTEQPLVPQGLAVAPDHSLYLALPEVNAYGQGQAIINIPRNLTSSSLSVTAWRFDGSAAPTYIALDATGNIWYTDRGRNLVGRLTPSTNVAKEWALPAGVSPIGLQLSGEIACVISDGLVQQAGVAQCLDGVTNRFTVFASTAMNRPQQLARNSFAELFVTEWSGNSIVFVGQDAYPAASIVTVTPTTRTLTRGSYVLYARDITVAPTVRTVVPTVTTVTGTNVGNGQTRFDLPKPQLTYPFALTGYPQPFGITAAFDDIERGSGTAYLAEYFLGPWGRFPAARIDKYEVVAARVIATSPNSLQFSMITGGAAPGNQSVAVTEASGLSLNWTATASQPWVTVSPVSGTAPASVSVHVNPASLGIGTHTAMLTFDDGPGKADPKSVAVTFTIEAQPSIEFSVPELTFAADFDDTTMAPAVFSVTNGGGGTLDCSATSSQPWIVVTEPSSCTFDVTLNPPTASGTHAGTITVDSPGATNAPATLDVTFTRAAAPDTAAPVLTLPASLTVEASGASGAVVVYTATAQDVVSGAVTPVCTPASGSIFAVGTTVVSCTATDGAQNAATGTFSVTVTDASAPALNLPSPVTAEATASSGATVTFTVTAANPADATISCTPASGSTFPIGVTTVTCTATSGGRQTTGQFTVTVSDATDPTLTLPATPTVEATSAAGAPVVYSVAALDTISGSVTPSCAPISGSTFALGSTTVTCTATDAAGNQASGTFTVIVQDTTGPAVTVPANILKEASGPLGATVTFSASATDLVGGALAPVCAPASGSTFAVTTTTVTCTATDASGNAASKSFTVTVQDTTAPALTLPGTVTATSPTGSSVPVTFTATASDLVSGTRPVTCTPVSGSPFGVGTTAVSCTASDTKGNTATGTFNVVVIAPSFSLGAASMYFKTGRLAYCNGLPVGPNWKDQGIVVTNTGSAAVTVSTSTATTWIKPTVPVSVPAGSSLTLTVSVDITALGRGIYQGAFTVSGGGAAKAVPVTLEIGNALPTLCLTPKVMGWGQVKLGTTTSNLAFDISNVGDDPMANFTATRVATDGTINMSATKGAAPRTITISVKTGRKKGAQTGTITVAVPGAIEGTQAINLSWSVQ